MEQVLDSIMMHSNLCVLTNILHYLDIIVFFIEMPSASKIQHINEPRSEKNCLQGFRPGKTQTGLLSYRD